MFAGVWHRFNVAVYENEDKVLLTTIFPKAGEVSWIMLRVDRILLVSGSFEKIEGKLLDKNVHILKQRVPDRHMTYLILLSPPTTVEFGSKEIGSKVFQKVLSLEEEVEKIKNLAKGSGVEILDLKDAPYKESASLLGNPTLLLNLLSIAPEGEEPEKRKLREIAVGEDGDRLFNVDEGIFDSFVSIKKGSEEERSYVAQALLEDAVIDAAPIPLVLDYGECPLKLSQANPYPYDYSKYGFESHNVGFDVEQYDLAAEGCPVRMNLNHVSVQLLWKMFGLGTDEASTLILQAAHRLQDSNGIGGLKDIGEEVRKTQAGTERDRVLAARALRMLRALDKAFGDVFSKESDTRVMAAEWIKKNKSVYLSMSGLDDRARLAFTLYLLEMLETLKESKLLSEIERRRVDHVFPAFLGLEWFGSGVMQDEIVDRIVAERRKGLFVNEGDLPMKIESRVTHKFHIIAPRRAKLFIGGKGREFDVRPLLSCPP